MAKSPAKKVVKKKKEDIVEGDKEIIVSKNPYELSVSIGDFNVSLETDDPVSALLDIKPAKVMQKTIFSLRQGGKSAEHFLYPLRAKRIFMNRLAAQFFVKRLLLSMK